MGLITREAVATRRSCLLSWAWAGRSYFAAHEADPLPIDLVIGALSDAIRGAQIENPADTADALDRLIAAATDWRDNGIPGST